MNYVAPLLPPLAVLGARALLALDPGRSRRAWVGIAAASVVLAVALPFLDAVHPWPIHVEGLLPVAACLLLTGIAALALRGPDPGPALLATAVGAAAAACLASLLVLPSLDPVASPRAQARALADLAGRGYAPLSYRVYPGTYSWHAGRAIPGTGDLGRVKALLETEPRVALAMSRRDFERHRDAFAGLRVAHEQWIVERPYVIVVKEAP